MRTDIFGKTSSCAQIFLGKICVWAVLGTDVLRKFTHVIDIIGKKSLSTHKFLVNLAHAQCAQTWNKRTNIF